MKRLALVLFALAAGCGGSSTERIYSWNDLMLVTQYTAKNGCSCLFVMEQTEDYCRAWLKQSPDLAHFTIDRQRKSVTANAAIFWGATATYVDDSAGCVLDP